MTGGSFARGALISLSETDLQAMFSLDETLFIEHKAGFEKGDGLQLAKGTSSFANTYGGWLLLGVHDGRPTGSTEAWATGGIPLVDAVRDRLRGLLDPLPAFEGKVFELDEGPVGVIRIYESSDTPHVVIPTGAVYVREAAGDSNLSKQTARGRDAIVPSAVGSQTQLRELAERGRRSRERLEGLLNPAHELPLIAERLGLRFEPTATGALAPAFNENTLIAVRALPHTLPARFRAWTTTADAARAAQQVAEDAADQHGFSPSWVSPHPAGTSITVPAGPKTLGLVDAFDTPLHAGVQVVADGAGVVGVSLDIRPPEIERRRRWFKLHFLAGLIRVPLLAAVGLLERGEFLGRATIQIDIIRLGNAMMLEGTRGENEPAFVPVRSEVTLPFDPEEIAETAAFAANAYARGAGMQAWDPAANPRL